MFLCGIVRETTVASTLPLLVAAFLLENIAPGGIMASYKYMLVDDEVAFMYL